MERSLIRLDQKLYGCRQCAWFQKCNYCGDEIRPRQETLAKFHFHKCEQNSPPPNVATNRRNSSQPVAWIPPLDRDYVRASTAALCRRWSRSKATLRFHMPALSVDKMSSPLTKMAAGFQRITLLPQARVPTFQIKLSCPGLISASSFAAMASQASACCL